MTLKHSVKHYTLCLTGLITLVISAPSLAKSLGADPFSASWSLDRDQYRCTLEQNVPQFGKVLFSRIPNSKLILEIHAATPIERGQASRLKARPPSWRTDISGYMISQNSKIGIAGNQATFNQHDSQTAYKSLRDGFALQLSLVHGSPPEPLDIAIGGLGFHELLSDFKQCQEESDELLLADNARKETERKAAADLARSMAKLNADSPKVAALTDGVPAASGSPLQQQLENLRDYYRIPFDEGDTELSSEGSGYLEQLLRRWELTGMPSEVALHGHSDDAEATGSYINSDLRAQSVARYLISKMPELQLRIEAHGDTLSLEKVSSQRVDVVPSDLPNWE